MQLIEYCKFTKLNYYIFNTIDDIILHSNDVIYDITLQVCRKYNLKFDLSTIESPSSFVSLYPKKIPQPNNDHCCNIF